MSYLRSWLGRSSTSTVTAGLTPEQELEWLQDAMAASKLIMNDKYDTAIEVLSKTSSPFHKYMAGESYMHRAILGTEPDTIKEGLVVLADAQRVIQEYLNKSLQEPACSHHSKIYPVGTVYNMMHANVQFMYAVVAIMNANLGNALNALFKMRRGYAGMEAIFKLEQEYARRAVKTSRTSISSKSTSDRRSFEYAIGDGIDFAALTDDPVDHFIHNGMCYSYGLLQWALSIIPEPFDKVLGFLQYRGDRKLGHSLMWEASKHPEDFHGALSSFTTLIIYNGLSARCDIRAPDAIPYDKIQGLLRDLQTHYPESHKFSIQESIMLAIHDKKLEEATEILSPGAQDRTAPKFITALCVFEQGCKYLYAHKHEQCAASFTDLATLTDWSYSLFRFAAGASYFDAYRTAVKAGDQVTEAERYATLANEALGNVNKDLCKRKVLGKPVPIELWIKGLVNGYLAKAAAKKCPLVEAIDVSPAEELIWLYGGYDFMPEAQILVSLEKIEMCETEEPEGLAQVALLQAACYRRLGKLDEARQELEENVLSPAKNTRFALNWIVPAAHFDLAVCYWAQAQLSKDDRASLQACAEQVRLASSSGGHDLQTMSSIKISTAKEALKKLGIQV